MQGRQWKSQPWTLSTCCFIIFNMFFINSVVMERCWNLCMRYYDLWLYKIKIGCATIEAQIQKTLDSFSLNNCPQEPVLKRWHFPKNGAFWTVRVNHPPPKNWTNGNSRPAAELLQDILPFTKSWYEIAWKGPGADESWVVLWLHWCTE